MAGTSVWWHTAERVAVRSAIQFVARLNGGGGMRVRGCSVLVVLGCAAVTFPVLAQATLDVDTERSYIVATTGKAGALGFLGHEHGVLATDWDAAVVYSAGAPALSTISLTIRAAALVVDTDEARRRARLAEGPAADEVPEIQARMVGPELLAVDQHPLIEFRSEHVELIDRSKLRVSGQFTLAGTILPVTSDVWVRSIQEFTLFSARFTIKQADFGIVPVSVGGVVKVANEIEVRVELWTRGAAEE